MKNDKILDMPKTVSLPFNICSEREEDSEVIEEVVTHDCYRLAELKRAGFRPHTIVDIGAHIGTFAVLANFHWPEAEIYCFEPDQRSFELLCQNAPFAKCYNKAVRNDEEKIGPSAPENEMAGRTDAVQRLIERRAPLAQSNHSFPDHPGDKHPTGLEHILSGNHLGTVDLLKLNCEGYEFDILKNAPAECLAKVKHVVGKHHQAEGSKAFMEVANRALPHLILECNSDMPNGLFFSKGHQRKLEIGFGLPPRPGYERLDLDPGLDFGKQSLMSTISCNDETFDELWATRVLERIDILEGQLVLKEWCRVLKINGFCQIETSNLESHLVLYLHGLWREHFETLTKEEKRLLSINGIPNKGLWLNYKIFSAGYRQQNIHRASYDPALLIAFCLEAGFSQTDLISFGPSLIIRAWK